MTKLKLNMIEIFIQKQTVKLAANLQHCSSVIVRQSCTNVDDMDMTLLQIQQQCIHFISMYRRQTVHIVHDQVIAITSKLLTLQINHQK